MEKISCEFARYGCSKLVVRGDMGTHLRDARTKHIQKKVQQNQMIVERYVFLLQWQCLEVYVCAPPSPYPIQRCALFFFLLDFQIKWATKSMIVCLHGDVVVFDCFCFDWARDFLLLGIKQDRAFFPFCWDFMMCVLPNGIMSSFFRSGMGRKYHGRVSGCIFADFTVENFVNFRQQSEFFDSKNLNFSTTLVFHCLKDFS